MSRISTYDNQVDRSVLRINESTITGSIHNHIVRTIAPNSFKFWPNTCVGQVIGTNSYRSRRPGYELAGFWHASLRPADIWSKLYAKEQSPRHRDTYLQLYCRRLTATSQCVEWLDIDCLGIRAMHEPVRWAHWRRSTDTTDLTPCLYHGTSWDAMEGYGG